MSADIKNALRKMDFPNSAKEALPRIETLIMGRTKQNQAMQLISEFIFLERAKDIEGRKGHQSPQMYATSQMTTLQEFQLILVLIEFFSQPGPDATRNAVFLSLFSTNLSSHRSKVLCHLISSSISCSTAPLLSSAGTWMQQVGCNTPPALEVAQSLVSDFIIFSRKISEQLKQLPLVAPNFAANFMTAVADLYMTDRSGAPLTPPPDSLLDVFTEWVTENPSLCLASQQPAALPSGAIAMPVITPIAGLLRWTVLAPLVSQRQAYSDLHLSLLITMMQMESKGPPTAINAQQLVQIITLLEANRSHDNMQKCLERFAQAVEVALAANAIYGSIPQLLCMLEALPKHPLLSHVINKNKIVT